MTKTSTMIVPAFLGLALILLAGLPVWGQERGSEKIWSETVQLAKKEGEVVIYGGSNHEGYFREFQKKFPEIRVKFLLGEGSQLIPRILAEIRAGKHLGDIFMGGLTPPYEHLYRNKLLAPLKPALVLPEVVDESKWYRGRHTYGDPEGNYIFAYEMSVRHSGVAYNTNLLDPKEIHSYWDLLHPKWKGKVVSLDPKARGPIMNNLRYFYYNPQLGPAFISRLFGEMEVILSRDDRQMMNWLGSGKFAWYMAPRGTDVAKAQGLPVDYLPRSKKEMPAIDLMNSTISILKTAPHPNAARLAVNWFLSREGQLAFQNYSEGRPGIGGNSAREDISKEMVDPIKRREKDVEYFFVSDPRNMDSSRIDQVVQAALEKALIRR